MYLREWKQAMMICWWIRLSFNTLHKEDKRKTRWEVSTEFADKDFNDAIFTLLLLLLLLLLKMQNI